MLWQSHLRRWSAWPCPTYLEAVLGQREASQLWLNSWKEKKVHGGVIQWIGCCWDWETSSTCVRENIFSIHNISLNQTDNIFPGFFALYSRIFPEDFPSLDSAFWCLLMRATLGQRWQYGLSELTWDRIQSWNGNPGFLAWKSPGTQKEPSWCRLHWQFHCQSF
jgi:hypothetical protein